MVCWFVEQQNIRRWCEDARKRRAALFATRHGGRIFFASEPKRIQEVMCAIGIITRAKARFDISERRRKTGEIRLLRQVAQRRAGLQKARAAICLNPSCCNLHQRRFARAIAPNKANAIACGERQVSALKERRSTKGEANILKREKSGSGHAPRCDRTMARRQVSTGMALFAIPAA